MSAAGTSAEAMQKQNRTEHKIESIAVPGMLFDFFIINRLSSSYFFHICSAKNLQLLCLTYVVCDLLDVYHLLSVVADFRIVEAAQQIMLFTAPAAAAAAKRVAVV